MRNAPSEGVHLKRFILTIRLTLEFPRKHTNELKVLL
jgi:hypothetical protein